MKVFLPPALEQFVEAKVADGQFASANDVVLAGLSLLREHDAAFAARLEEIRRGLRAPSDH